MPGSKRVDFRDSEGLEAQIRAKTENVSDFIRSAIKEKLQGTGSETPLDSEQDKFAGDIIWLIQFFNNGYSKTHCSPEQINRIKEMYGRAKNV